MDIYSVVILAVVLSCLVILWNSVYNERDEYKRKIRELERKIMVYDKSDKVIKNCVVYTPEEAITLNGSNIAIMDCKFEQLGRNPATKALRECLGLK